MPTSPPACGSRRRQTAVGSNAGVLPPDVLFDVLLRLPVKELCRLRVVCRSWRLLTSDPLFTSAHAARHPDQLFLANFRDDPTHISVVDLNGNVVKRIPNAHGHLLVRTSMHLACAATERNSCCVINPATARVHVLPQSLAMEHFNLENLSRPYTSFTFGRIATTGEYKVLRIFIRPNFAGINQYQVFEVFTLNSGSSHAKWRASPSHDCFVEANSAIVVGGVVHFKMDAAYDAIIGAGIDPGIHPDSIISFDLEREEWRGDLQGPITGTLQTDVNDDLDEYRGLWSQLTLADLRGLLALVHYHNHLHIMDLWLLEDFENGLWVKEYSIQTELIFPTTEWRVKAVFMLEDGRLVIHFPLAGLLLIYDPITNTSAQVEMRHLDAAAMYTGNLLSLQDGDVV